MESFMGPGMREMSASSSHVPTYKDVMDFDHDDKHFQHPVKVMDTMKQT